MAFVIFIFQQFANASIINTPPALTPPCDQDNIELSEASCTGNSTIPSEGIHYEICEEMEDNFFGTLGKMSDAKCPGEDRIILCELEGGMISNINENTRFNLLNLAFLKTYQNENVRAVSKHLPHTGFFSYFHIGREAVLLVP